MAMTTNGLWYRRVSHGDGAFVVHVFLVADDVVRLAGEFLEAFGIDRERLVAHNHMPPGSTGSSNPPAPMRSTEPCRGCASNADFRIPGGPR